MRTQDRPGDSEKDPAPVAPPPEAVAGAAADRVFALEAEVAQLKEAVTSHAVVDQAIGSLVALARVTPDQGWAVLKEVSQHTNVKLRQVAETVLLWARTGDLPEEIRTALEEALISRRASAGRPVARSRFNAAGPGHSGH
ncbi:ANTAR domain-containing protein [Streptomyces sp. NPDC056600]|uniref:ANTAR domain-containing protein n=1 Tax=Streptomyces sp. NPDC056600 TaxID=3345874 RepID=UPI003688BB07